MSNLIEFTSTASKAFKVDISAFVNPVAELTIVPSSGRVARKIVQHFPIARSQLLMASSWLPLR
ncbi:MAG: hypothetical protein V7K53_21455 [Nostoc sp.]|uniref:hypothetical protein n=1 Tax=Nostoc sp. TaxID=1180 RepID=UPI002FFAC1ED